MWGADSQVGRPVLRRAPGVVFGSACTTHESLIENYLGSVSGSSDGATSMAMTQLRPLSLAR